MPKTTITTARDAAVNKPKRLIEMAKFRKTGIDS
jgi:hypothetical protein